MLVRPIKQLSDKISGINEKFITPIDISTLPEEFLPLGETLNNLITRLTTFITYQKELFIGTAHELKTPLAVMKLKNEVTLIKKREIEVYINAMKHNNQTINQMNKTIGDILNIGRQESAQFEPPIKMDVIQYLNKIGSDFKLLAQSQNKNLLIELEPKSFNVVIQKTLLNQIIQNFLQNALKFTPEQNTITVKSYLNYYGLKIEIYDEGIGVDENVDLFAPFKRVGNQQGVGLGLFLAKSAADALDAKISIKNRLLSKGTIASLEIKTNLTCILPKL
jgi:two-component system OmpR family sensor kinase